MSDHHMSVEICEDVTECVRNAIIRVEALSDMATHCQIAASR